MGVARPLGAAMPYRYLASTLHCDGRINAVAGVHRSGCVPDVCFMGMPLGLSENGTQK